MTTIEIRKIINMVELTNKEKLQLAQSLLLSVATDIDDMEIDRLSNNLYDKIKKIDLYKEIQEA